MALSRYIGYSFWISGEVNVLKFNDGSTTPCMNSPEVFQSQFDSLFSFHHHMPCRKLSDEAIDGPQCLPVVDRL